MHLKQDSTTFNNASAGKCHLFEQFIYEVNEEVTSYLSKGTLVFADGTTLEQAREMRTDLSRTSTNKQEERDLKARRRAAASAGQGSRSKPQTIRRTEKKVGRNDPCPCGSGKKYKKCHGKNVA